MTYSNGARIELTRDSIILEERLKPTTEELNSRSLRINRETWLRNLEAAEENAWFLIDYCRHLTGDESFRPNSSADCARALIAGGWKLKASKENGKLPTDKDTLCELSNEGSALAEAIIDARSAISRWSQLKAWKAFADAGFVQPYWDSLGTPHGRYTSDAPCLTNRIEPIRATVEPDQGYSFLSLDLSQAEYVVWASLSNDQILSTLFLQGRDFHAAMAESVRKAVPSWNIREQSERDAGKTLNFAILYQMKPHTLARKLGCSVEVANRIIKAYYSKVPVAHAYIADVLARAEAMGYVETFYGRRRYCPEYQNGITERDAHEVEKTLFNHVIAGSSAEVVKRKQVVAANRHPGQVGYPLSPPREVGDEEPSL
jgi:DNA polymerase I